MRTKHYFTFYLWVYYYTPISMLSVDHRNFPGESKTVNDRDNLFPIMWVLKIFSYHHLICLLSKVTPLISSVLSELFLFILTNLSSWLWVLELVNDYCWFLPLLLNILQLHSKPPPNYSLCTLWVNYNDLIKIVDVLLYFLN